MASMPSDDCWTRTAPGVAYSTLADCAATTTAAPGQSLGPQLYKKDCYVPSKVFNEWTKAITENSTWLYIFTQDMWIIFVIVLYFSKYGAIKLGRDTDVPEHSNFSWFSMIFTCGVATGLFYYAAAEPIYHYSSTNNNRYSHLNDNLRAQWAMNLTWYHWGIHGWVCYAIMGALLALLHFRKGLPMTVKTCFYPLLGERIYGLAGDIVDIISTVATTMGVCTSLGLGVMQINSAIERLNGGQHWLGRGYFNKYNFDDWKSDVDDLKSLWDGFDTSKKEAHPWYDCKTSTVNIDSAAFVQDILAENNQQIFLIWVITIFATVSVMSGVTYGIKTLANVCLAAGMFFMTYILIVDDTYYILNLFVQSIGFYVQNFIQLGFHTGAFSQSEHGEGVYSWSQYNISVLDKTGAKHEVEAPVGERQNWMAGWTMFYWGWWIAWSPFVGVFMGRISRGRTLREFFVGTIILPVIYNVMFMTIIGGAALKSEMLATNENFGNFTGNICDHSLDGTATPGIVDGLTQMKYGKNICRPTIHSNPFTTEKELFCSTVVKLSCGGTSGMLWDLMYTYSDMARFLIIVGTIALILYFVASSDSGSLVDDMVTANGLPEPPLLQRWFWATTEGLAATALMYSGRFTGQQDTGLKALQAMSICAGLPYTYFICFFCVSLWRTCQLEYKDRSWNSCFKWSIVDIGVTSYRCKEGKQRRCNFEIGRLDWSHLGKVVALILFPFVSMYPAAKKLEETKKKRGNGGNLRNAKLLVGGAMLCFYAYFIFSFCEYIPPSTEPYVWGSVKGNKTDKPTGNDEYYISKRYGYYREWKETPTSNKEAIKFNDDVDLKYGELPYNGHGVGDRVARTYRIEAIGLFFFFFFALLLSQLRFQTRELLGVSGSLLEDYLVSLFFYPTVLYQIEAELNADQKIEDRDCNQTSDSISNAMTDSTSKQTPDPTPNLMLDAVPLDAPPDQSEKYPLANPIEV